MMTNAGDDIGPPPPFDPEFEAAVPEIRRKVCAPLTPATIGHARARSTAGELSSQALSCGGAFAISELGFETRDEPPVPLRLLFCRPVAVQPPYGLLFHIHGGGMVAGSWRSTELACDLERARQTGMAVISVDYRLAPEHPHPTPMEDCYQALLSIIDRAGALEIDAGRIFLSGNSAGGGLAAMLALRAKSAETPAISGAMLQCPMLDDRCSTVSARQMEDYGIWDTRSNRVGWEALFGNGQIDGAIRALIPPARHGDLSGLPPMFIDVGSAESLRDEAVTFASRIWACGGSAELHVWSGAFHSFDQWVPDAEASRGAESARLSWLRRMLS